MWITSTYRTHICFYELGVIGKEILQKYSITVCYNAARTSAAFVNSALIDKCLLLWWGFFCHFIFMYLIPACILKPFTGKDMGSFYSWEWELAMLLSPRKSLGIIEALSFKISVEHPIN